MAVPNTRGSIIPYPVFNMPYKVYTTPCTVQRPCGDDAPLSLNQSLGTTAHTTQLIEPQARKALLSTTSFLAIPRDMEVEGEEGVAQASTAPEAATKRTRMAPPSTLFQRCRPALSLEALQVVTEMGFESMTPVQVKYDNVVLFPRTMLVPSSAGVAVSVAIVLSLQAPHPQPLVSPEGVRGL